MSIVQDIFNQGVKECEDPHLATKIRLTNMIYVMVSGIALLYIIIFAVFGFYFFVFTNITLFIAISSTAVFNRYRFYVMSRVSALIYAPAVCSLYALIIGPESGLHFFAFTGICVGTVLFTEKERHYMLLTTLPNLFFILLPYLTTWTPLPDYQIDDIVVKIINIVTLILVGVSIIISGKYLLDNESNFRKEVELAQQDLAQLKIDKIERRRRDAENKARFQKNFLAKMSHEIRTPMNGVIGLLDVFEEDNLSEDQKNKLNIISNSSKILLEIINDILDYSKLQEGKMDLYLEPVDLDNLLNGLVDLYKPICESKGINIRLEAQDLPAFIKSDFTRVNQVLNNLISNAVKFTSEGEVVLKASYEDNELSIEVIDQGIGMTKDSVDKLFKEFSQVHREKSKYKGTGLGLAICKSIAELFDGELSVKSELGKGSMFKFVIPTEPSKMTKLITDNRGFNIEGKGRKILVVDDLEINLKVAKIILEKLGFIVTTCNSGMKAIDVCGAEEFDFIFMDIEMPEMNGITTTRILKEKCNVTSPIIAVTANAMADQKHEYLEEGIDSFIAKPITMEKINSCLSVYSKRS